MKRLLLQCTSPELHKADPTRLARHGSGHWGTPAPCKAGGRRGRRSRS
jgi:hypothetical protein